jgi:P4 family phage/plasmid primase-like protien
MKFLEYFPNHKYRYIKKGEPAKPSAKLLPELNKNGYESYFTVNGFASASDNKKEQCINLTAFFIDIDGRKNLDELEDIKKRLDPTFIIETKNGHHVYWLLDEVVYKEDIPNEWASIVARWERIEQAIVTALNADPVVKDITRIMRVPDTQYWKTGDGAFIIKGIYKKEANTYTMDTIEEAFPTAAEPVENPHAKVSQEYADSERKNFFDRVNEEYPIIERTSFMRLMSGKADTFVGNSRNVALLVTASLMKQAGWTKAKAVAHVAKIGWHGIESEAGGKQEIATTINSAFANNYTYSHKHPVIAGNMDELERNKIQEAFAKAHKARKELNKVRYANYEKEILDRNPYLRRNDIGMFFNYVGGVYRIMTDQDMSNLVLTSLDYDMLLDFRTAKHVSDKLKCLISITPPLEITDDRGRIANVKNGLLDIFTRELKPHTPEYVSLSQSPVSYDPTALCPVWNDCLTAWMEGPEAEEKKTVLQMFSGYCLSSSMTYDKALFLIGDGGNGKSTFIDTISGVVGKDATSHIDLEDLYRQFGMKGLIGKRLNVIEEVHGNYYQSNKLKKLISGEPVTIDQKFKDQYTFRPQAKFAFAVNTMPRVDDTSTATERRIAAVMFRNNFRTMPNINLRGESGLLARERSGILNWMLDGANLLDEKKTFPVTAEQVLLLKEYREENSSVDGFIGDCLDFKEGELVEVRELYNNYKEYCQKDGRKFKSNIAFTKEMKAYGTRHHRFSFKDREYAGAPSKFEGIVVNEEWKKISMTHSYDHYGD